jgi:hypothetical protein
LVGGRQFVADAVAQTALILDFSNAAAPVKTNIIITGKLKDGTPVINTLTIPAGTKPGVMRDMFYSTLEDAGLKVTVSGENRLIIKSNTKSVLASLDFQADNAQWKGPSLPAIIDNAATTPTFSINGKNVPVTP